MMRFILGALFALGCIYLNGFAFGAMICFYALLGGVYAAAWYYV